MGTTNFSALGLDSTAATAASNAVTTNATAGIITSESLTTLAGSEYICTMTNNRVGASSIILNSAGLGSSTTGVPACASATVAAGSVIFNVTNLATSAAFNGTVTISYVIINPVAV